MVLAAVELTSLPGSASSSVIEEKVKGNEERDQRVKRKSGHFRETDERAGDVLASLKNFGPAEEEETASVGAENRRCSWCRLK